MYVISVIVYVIEQFNLFPSNNIRRNNRDDNNILQHNMLYLFILTHDPQKCDISEAKNKMHIEWRNLKFSYYEGKLQLKDAHFQNTLRPYSTYKNNYTVRELSA